MVDDPMNPQDENDAFTPDDDFLAAARYDEEDAADGFNASAGDPKQNLKEIWDSNPSLKIFAVVAGIALFLIAFMVFSSDKGDEQQESVIRQNAQVTQAPGTAELPPAYEEAVRQASEQRAQEAEMTGGSSFPTQIARPSERIEAPVQVEEVDPLAEWRREAEAKRAERAEPEVAPALPQPEVPVDDMVAEAPINRIGQQQQQQPANPPLPTGPTPEMVNAMAQQLQQQMQTVLETQVPRESVVVSMNIQPGYDMAKYYPPEDKTNPQGGVNTAGNVAGNNALPTANGLQPVTPAPIVLAGTILYAQMLTEANSDVPGPILAEIASGPLSGGRALGQFQVAQRHLVLQFNRVVKDGVEYPTMAYAIDPATARPGVMTDIDNHYFTRVFLPAAARFIEGFADAATRTTTQAVVTNGSVVTNTTNDLNTRQEIMQGVNEGARQLSQIIDQQSQRPRTVIVAAGTRIGILFVNSVTAGGQNGQAQPAQSPVQQYFNTTPVGQAYNAYNAAQSYTNQTGMQPQTFTAGGQQYNYVPMPQTQASAAYR